MGYLKLQIIGNLGGDVRVGIVNGKQVLNMSVCYTEKWKDQSGVQKEKSIWLDAAYWNDSTAIAQYLKKGQQVFLEGIPDVKTYENNNRQVVAQLTLRVNQLQLLGGQRQDSSQSNAPAPQQEGSDIPQEKSDLPF